MRPHHAARGYARVLGATAALFCLLQVLVNVQVARGALTAVITIQRSLAGIAQGNGVSIDAFAGQLAGALLVSMLVGLATLVIVLGFCWYAGRVAAALTGEPAAGGMAGRQVVLVSGLIWVAASLAALLAYHADASLSWLVATIALLIPTAAGATPTGIYVTAPSSAFTSVQVGALLIQQWIGLLIAFGLGTLAGRAGAASLRSASVNRPYAPPRVPMPPQYLPGYPPPPGAFPPAWSPPAIGYPPPASQPPTNGSASGAPDHMPNG